MIVPDLCIGGKHYFVVEKLLLYSFEIGNENDLPEFTISV